MFQNINENTINQEEYKENIKENKKIDLFTNVFSIKNIQNNII